MFVWNDTFIFQLASQLHDLMPMGHAFHPASDGALLSVVILLTAPEYIFLL
jgi:hypothetical protein